MQILVRNSFSIRTHTKKNKLRWYPPQSHRFILQIFLKRAAKPNARNPVDRVEPDLALHLQPSPEPVEPDLALHHEPSPGPVEPDLALHQTLPFSGTFSGTFRRPVEPDLALRNLLQNPVKPALALYQSLPDLLRPSPKPD